MYVFDTTPLSSLFRNYFRSAFPTLWRRLDQLIADGSLTSTREVRRELDQYARADSEWLTKHAGIFTTPTASEAAIVREIYRVRHFHQNIEQKKIQNGGLVADAFVVAKAADIDGIVVTLETAMPNAAKIPNMCEHLEVPCINLEQFMSNEGWTF
ncbi:MAG: DUF4411 family protein [Gammaproteobacteria bacterium]|nr:DUF4411 family protein [Gammaproteobacteria bacterium]